MRTFEWAIEDIVSAHPELYLEHCAVMAVALMSRQTASPCEFLVQCDGFSPSDLDGETSFLLQIAWSEQTAQKAERVWVAEQVKPIVERAAVALAALVFAHLIPDGRILVTEEGNRADYSLPRLKCAPEISGTQRSRELPHRQREKKAQLLANPRAAGTVMYSSAVSVRHAGSSVGPITARRNPNMARDKTKSAAALIEQMLGEASWLLSHTQALTDYGRLDEAMVERGHAATCEEQVACLLEADGQEQEAAIHRVSAAACYEKLGQFSRAVTLLHAALSTPLSHDYRTRVEKQLARCLGRAYEELSHAPSRPARGPSRAIP